MVTNLVIQKTVEEKHSTGTPEMLGVKRVTWEWDAGGFIMPDYSVCTYDSCLPMHTFMLHQ